MGSYWVGWYQGQAAWFGAGSASSYSVQSGQQAAAGWAPTVHHFTHFTHSSTGLTAAVPPLPRLGTAPQLVGACTRAPSESRPALS